MPPHLCRLARPRPSRRVRAVARRPVRDWALLVAVLFDHGARLAQQPCPAGAAAEIHFGPGEDLETIDVALLREATKQIDMAAYVLT
jgi:hypothetical protein